MTQEREEPCEITGTGCDWTYDDWEDNDGNWYADCYCTLCFRPRDFSLAEFVEKQIDKPANSALL